MKTKEDDNKFIKEMALRCNLIMPTNEEEMIWFDDACDVTKSDFIIRLYHRLGIEGEHTRRVKNLRKLRP